MARPLASLLGLILLMTAGPWATAQQLYVLTTPRMVTGDPVGVVLQAVDLDTGHVLWRERIRGTIPSRPMLLDETRGHVMLSTGPSGNDLVDNAAFDRGYVSVFAPTPLRRLDLTPSEHGHELFAEAWATGTNLLAVLAPDDPNPIRILNQKAGNLLENTPFAPLLGTPVAAVFTGNGNALNVLAREGEGQPAVVLYRIDTDRLDIINGFRRTTLGDFPERFGAEPAGLAASADGEHLFVLVSGYTLGRPSGEAASWLHVFDATTLREIAPPVQLPGSAQLGDQPLTPGPNSACWVATRYPGADYATATCLQFLDGEIAPIAETSFFGLTSPLRIAAGPRPASAAIGAGNRLHISNADTESPAAHEFPSPIETVTWHESGLFIGEAGRIHRIDPNTAAPVRTVQLQTGFVVDALPIPDHVTATVDEDVIPFDLPHTLTFHGEAIQQEFRCFPLEGPFETGSRWRIEYNEDEAPWLGVHPREGLFPGIACFIVYPGMYDVATEHAVSTTIHVGVERPGGITQSETVEIRILPDPKRLRRVLWIWDERDTPVSVRHASDPQGLRGLANKLAGPPFYFSHQEKWGPIDGPLDPYTIVVLTTEVASHGAITRQALLDYVAGGGSLLLLGEYNPAAETQAAAGWLSPAGLRITPTVPLNGAFQAVETGELTRHWDEFTIHNGCMIRIDAPGAAIVPGPGDAAVFGTLPYGRGSIAVLASASPLSTTSLDNPPNWRFAGDLIDWLARARKEIIDADGDGIPDAVEDRNQNNRVDPGETSRLHVDTDGDGIPDHLEDLNRNGRVDEGETSPVNPDSDGDGIFDGADPFPLPPIGALHLAEVHLSEQHTGPVQGPAEGGTMVLVRGRNFAPQTAVHFGDRPSPRTRRISPTELLAETPAHESPSGGTVPVSVVNVDRSEESVLPTGFTYTPISKVQMVFSNMTAMATATNVYQGSFNVSLATPPSLTTGRMAFELTVEPEDALEHISFELSAEALQQGRSVYAAHAGEDLKRYVITPPERRSGLTDLGRVIWRARIPGESLTLRFSTNFFLVMASNNVLLDTEPASITIQLPPRAAVRR